MRECQSLNPDPAVSEDEDYMEAEEEDLGEEGDVEEMQNLQIHGKFVNSLNCIQIKG